MSCINFIEPPSNGRTTAPSPWKMVVAKRKDAPPLRFRARELTCHQHDGQAIRLLERKSPGYVVSLDLGPVHDAATVPSVNDAIAWLEDVCQRPATSFSDCTIGDFLSGTTGHLTANGGFRSLAGDALDAWDRLLEPPEAKREGTVQ